MNVSTSSSICRPSRWIRGPRGQTRRHRPFRMDGSRVWRWQDAGIASLILLFQKVTDMPRRHNGQLAKDLVTLLLVEGEGLKTGGFQMVVGDALALGVLLHGAEQAAAPAVAADAFVDPEPVDVQPAPLDVGDDTAVNLALFILDKACDPLAQMGAGVILVVARETNAQRFDLIVLRRLGWGELHGASCLMMAGGWLPARLSVRSCSVSPAG